MLLSSLQNILFQIHPNLKHTLNVLGASVSSLLLPSEETWQLKLVVPLAINALLRYKQDFAVSLLEGIAQLPVLQKLKLRIYRKMQHNSKWKPPWHPMVKDPHFQSWGTGSIAG